MSFWSNLDLNERKVLIQQTVNKEGIHELAVEKDWWVSVVLKALFNCECKDYLLFKGGTSLSKGWNLIQRFSEDIDIALDKSFFEIKGETKSQRDKLRKKSRKYINQILKDELERNLKEFGINDFKIEFIETKSSDVDPSVINIVYKSVFDSKVDYIRNVVKVEISCLSLFDPHEKKDISSLIYKSFPNEDNDSLSQIKTVLPSRTFLEKIFLLNEEFQRENPRSNRMSRHLYDLEKMMNNEFANQALANKDLYNTIIEHRKVFYNLNGVDYSKNESDKINIIPPINIFSDWEKDYMEMKRSFIYSDSLSFYDLIKRITELQEIIHSISK